MSQRNKTTDHEERVFAITLTRKQRIAVDFVLVTILLWIRVSNLCLTEKTWDFVATVRL